MKKLLSMREFSHFSGIAQTTLRYWDSLTLFSPAYRDPDTNYRYYSPEQIMAVKFISILSALHVPLETIGAAQQSRTPESIMNLIERQEKLLDTEMNRVRERYSLMRMRLELIRRGARRSGAADTEEPCARILDMEEMPFILGQPNEYGDGEPFIGPFIRFCRQADELRINLNYPIGACHMSMDAFLGDPGRPEYFLSLDPTGNRVCPAGKYLVGITRGNYGELADLPEKMTAFAEENALTLSGPVYTIYLYDEICMADPSRYLAQVCVAVS